MDKKSSEQAIYALRNGVVPNMDLSLFMTGREQALTAMEKALSLSAGPLGVVKIIQGQYGSGKTFFLKKIKQDALAKNFVVADIQIDRSFRFNKLEDFYYHVMHHLYHKEKGGKKSSFDEIFNHWIESLRHAESNESASKRVAYVIKEINAFHASFARAFLEYIRNKIKGKNELSNAIMAWLCGEKNIPYELKAQFSVVGEIDKTNGLDFLNAFIKLLTLIGYTGLVIILDEFELVMDARTDIRQAAYTNLRNIIDMGAGGQIQNMLFLLAVTPDMCRDEEKGLPSYEALNQRIHPLSQGKDGLLLSLSPFDFNMLASLTENIRPLYESAYETHIDYPSETLRNWALFSKYQDNVSLHHVQVRAFLMALIEILDLLRENPAHPMFKSALKIVADAEKIRFVNHF